jgi:glycosyltransferase involved in cell wall biosynthesis
VTESNTERDRVALLTQQVSHYHAARYRAAAKEFGELRVFSLMNSADFDEFLSRPATQTNVVRVFEGRTPYARAVLWGTLWGRVHAELDAYAPNVVVVAGWSFPESLAAIAWARKSGARVAIMSASQPHDAARGQWREAVKRRVVSACDAALVAAGPHGDYAYHLGIPADHVFFGYDAVDNDYFAAGADHARARESSVRKERGLPERYVLASGRFITKKNFPLLVEAFAIALARGNHEHHLVILGDGSERGAIEEAARRHGIAGRVRLPGFHSYEALPDLYGLAEGFVHIALSEQWGLVINEAAAAAQPLVVSRPCGAAAALVRQDVNGFLVEPGDVEGISSALHKVMSLSREERATMGAASRRIVGDWSPDRYARGLRDACNAALARPPRSLGLPDRLLFRLLSHLQISAVR